MDGVSFCHWRCIGIRIRSRCHGVLLLRTPDSMTACLECCLAMLSFAILSLDLHYLSPLCRASLCLFSFEALNPNSHQIHGSYRLTDSTNMQPAVGYDANSLTDYLSSMN